MTLIPKESIHPATGAAPNYQFTPTPPSSRVAPTRIDELPQQAHTQPGDGGFYAPKSDMTHSQPGAKVPFKEQVIGYSQKFRGTLLGKPDLKAHGEAILDGRTTHAQDHKQSRRRTS